MKAMILAAGLGTRFQPVTFTLPKPLIPVCNKPLIAWAVDSFLAQGIHDFIVNLHHLPDPIRAYLPRAYPQARFEFSFEEEILGTGGGIRRIRRMLEGEEEFFVANGDTIQSVPVEALRRARGDAIAALTLRHPPEGDHFTPVFYDDGRVTGFGSGIGEALMFAGSHLISTRAFDLMPDKDVFGIVEELYQPLLQRGGRIAAVVHDAPWHDIGTPRRYLAASAALCAGNVVGARSAVEGTLRDSVVWDDCRIGAGVVLERCIVTHGVQLDGPVEYREMLITSEEIRPI